MITSIYNILINTMNTTKFLKKVSNLFAKKSELSELFIKAQISHKNPTDTSYNFLEYDPSTIRMNKSDIQSLEDIKNNIKLHKNDLLVENDDDTIFGKNASNDVYMKNMNDIIDSDTFKETYDNFDKYKEIIFHNQMCKKLMVIKNDVIDDNDKSSVIINVTHLFSLTEECASH